jgi:O-antigen/teichoic acid export membrane protein
MNLLSSSYIKGKWADAGFQKYFKSTGWMFISRILSMIISFIATIIIARKLGPENYGQLSYALSFVAIFSFIASLGIDSVLYRELVKYPEKRKEYLGSAFVMKLIAGVFTAAVIAMSAILFSQDDVSKVLIFILAATFLFYPPSIVNYEFQAKVKSKLPSIAALAITLILNILKILVIFSNKGVIYLALILLLEPILYAIFYLIAYKIEFNETIFSWKYNKEISIKILKDSWPMIIMGAFSIIYGRIDQVLIKNMIDSTSVGIYGSAVTIAEAWYFAHGIITTSLYPAVVNAKKTSEELYEKRLKKFIIALFGLSVGISIITMVFAPLIMSILYGAAFSGGIIVLQIYVWANVGVSLNSVIFNYLLTENYRKIILFISFIPMIINVILNLIWIPKYGIVGSAYATAISYVLGPLSIMLFKPTREKMIKIFKS